jgi:hypothetical protein
MGILLKSAAAFLPFASLPLPCTRFASPATIPHSMTIHTW